MWRTASITFSCGLLALLASALLVNAAEPLPPPSGPVILTVSGHIAVTNGDARARFDRTLLERLPQSTLTTETDWTDGPQRFEGVLLRDVMERLDAHGKEIVARAINDYKAVIPWNDLAAFPVLVALKRNGENMAIRDKGPLWIVYPSPARSPDRAGPHNLKMVWQLEQLNVE